MTTLECHSGGVLGSGNPNADIMLVGIAPGKDEWTKTKKPFTGPSGKLLDGLLKLIGLTRDEVYATNLICWWKDAPTPEEIKECYPRFRQEVEAVKPKIIICLGTIVCSALTGLQFGKAQGGVFWSGTYNAWMIVTFHPAAYLYHGGAMKVDIADGVRDFRKIPLYLDKPKTYGNVEYEALGFHFPGHSADEINPYLEHYSEQDQGKVVSIDIETFYDGSGMISMSIACEHGCIHIPRHLINGPDYSHLAKSDCRWTFHNGQFDASKMKKFLYLNLPIVEDTMLMSYSLDERSGATEETDSGGQDRAVGIHGLKRLAREYLAGAFYDAEAHGKIDQLDPEALAYYNSCDAIYTYRLQRLMEEWQIADGVRDMYLTLLIPAANTLMEISERGAYIDKKAMKALAVEWLPRWLKAEEELNAEAQLLGWDKPEINTHSAPQLQRFLFDICKMPQISYGKKSRTTAQASLKTFVAEYPDHPARSWVQKLLEWRGLDKDINVYIRGIQDDMDSLGFIHPEALLHGTRVGRLSYRKPPVQTIPKARSVGDDRARIRKIFAASPPSPRGTGPRLLMEADFRQAELWAASFVSGDEQVIEDLDSGDFHARMAEANWGKTQADCADPTEWENLRDSAKITVYGIQYGAAAHTLTGENRVGRGVGGNYQFLATKEQAQKAINTFATRYAKLWAWREAEKQYVLKEGEQISWTGRKRRYFMIQSYQQLNQAINMPISSLSHDHLLMGLIELQPLLAEFDAWILFDVHDSIMIDLPKMYLREVATLANNTLSKPRFGLPRGIPVDIKIGEDWYDTHKYDPLASSKSS